MNKHLRIAGEHALATGFSSTTGAHDCAASIGTNVRWNAPIAYVAKKLWPLKTVENFAAYVGCSPRTAQYILSSKAKRGTMRVDFVVRMFAGKHGHEFLKAWMDESDAEWWQRLADLEKQAEENERQLAAIRQAIKSA